MISTQLYVNKILSQKKKKPERINYADVGYCRLDVVTGLLEVTPRRVRGSERRDCQ